MIGDAASLLRGGDAGPFLEPADDAVDGIHKVVLLDEAFATACGDQCGLVADVGDVGAGESWGLSGQEVGVDGRVDFDRAEVDVEDLLALVEVGQLDVDLSVEASGTQQGFVEHIGAVGGGQDDHAAVRPEAVHLREELIEGTLALIVAGHVHVLATRPSDGVDLVDEDDARSLLFGLSEEVSDT